MKVPGVNYEPGEFLYETGKMMQFLLMSDGMFQWPTVLGERFRAVEFGKPVFRSVIVKVEPATA
jgi:hypothetical protein